MAGTALDVVKQYLEGKHSGVELLAEDAVFTFTATGQQWRGPEAITGMLTYFYQEAFHAHTATKKLFGDDRFACLEADVVGTHTGEFAGVPATGKQVSVPMTVVYEVADGKIVSGDVYFEIPALLAQLGAAQSSEASAA
jgi:steroid delta-isomerase-like uncharacterized protein